jgi:hypothetical protein
MAGLRMVAETGFAAAMPADQQVIRGLLAGFEPITLAQMDGVALLDRSELKFVIPQNLLAPVLAYLCASYRVLVVNGRRLSRYRTLYFDTDDLELYRRHHGPAARRSQDAHRSSHKAG